MTHTERFKQWLLFDSKGSTRRTETLAWRAIFKDWALLDYLDQPVSMRDSPDGVGTGEVHASVSLLCLNLQQLSDDLDQPLHISVQQRGNRMFGGETPSQAASVQPAVSLCWLLAII